MVEINLLPWRDQRQRHEDRMVKKILMVMAAVSLSCLFGGYVWANHYVEKYQDQLSLLQAEWTSLLSEKQRYDEAQARIEKLRRVSANVRHYQASTQSVFVSLTEALDHHLCFTSIRREKNIYSFSGYSLSSVALSDFLREWRAAELFSEMKITKLNKLSHSHYMAFQFQAVERHAVTVDADSI